MVVNLNWVRLFGTERFVVSLTNLVAGTLGNSVGVGNILDYIPQGSTFLGNSLTKYCELLISEY